MTTAPHTFRRRVDEKKGKGPRPVAEFMIESNEPPVDGVEPEPQQYHATMPTDERLFLLAALAGAEDATGAEEAAATLDLLKDALPADEFRTLRRRIADPDDFVDIAMVQDILMWLIGEWTTFPTEPSSASSVSPPSTGARSTGRVRGEGSTHSTSR